MRRVSNALKRARGTLRGDRARVQFTPPAGAPDAPQDAPDALRRHHAELVSALDGVVTKADASVIWLTAQALAEVDEYTVTLAAEGTVYASGRRGMRRPHPAVQLRDAAWRRALAGLRALGLSPTDRHRVMSTDAPRFLDVSRYSR